MAQNLVMIDYLKALAVFAVVVEEKSFRRAAGRLSLSPSVVSHHITSLEKRLGAALIYRSTRSFSLTQQGRQLAKSASTMLPAAADGLSDLSQSGAAALTQLRVAIPEMLTSNPLFDRVSAFAQQNPGVQLVLTSSDTATNLVRETMDVAIRVGRLRDSELKAKKIGQDQQVVVASPAFLAKHKKPVHPDDLRAWRRISFSPVPDDLVFTRAGVTVRPDWESVAAVTDSVHVMHKLVCAGLGIAGLPDALVRAEVKAGRLRRVLPGWAGRTLDIFVVWHKNVSARSITRRFIDHMSDAL